jgi:anti-sigma regulatory factor (Ser/Thr protein kinase)
MEFLYDVAEEIRALAGLLLSELVTNAIQHAGTHFSLCAELTPSNLRVEVADGATDLPVVLNPEPDAPSGRGMLLVSRMASNWGVEPIPDGKLVWFELALR